MTIRPQLISIQRRRPPGAAVPGGPVRMRVSSRRATVPAGHVPVPGTRTLARTDTRILMRSCGHSGGMRNGDGRPGDEDCRRRAARLATRLARARSCSANLIKQLAAAAGVNVPAEQVPVPGTRTMAQKDRVMIPCKPSAVRAPPKRLVHRRQVCSVGRASSKRKWAVGETRRKLRRRTLLLRLQE